MADCTQANSQSDMLTNLELLVDDIIGDKRFAVRVIGSLEPSERWSLAIGTFISLAVIICLQACSFLFQLYSSMTLKDGSVHIELARSSKQIAELSFENSSTLKTLAGLSLQNRFAITALAELTLKNSSAMKDIAGLGSRIVLP